MLSVPGCDPDGDMDLVLAVSGSERGIQGNETLQMYKFSITSVLKSFSRGCITSMDLTQVNKPSFTLL